MRFEWYKGNNLETVQEKVFQAKKLNAKAVGGINEFGMLEKQKSCKFPEQ